MPPECYQPAPDLGLFGQSAKNLNEILIHLRRSALKKSAAASDKESVPSEDSLLAGLVVNHIVANVARGVARSVKRGDFKVSNVELLAVRRLFVHARDTVVRAVDPQTGNELVKLLIATRMIKVVVSREDVGNLGVSGLFVGREKLGGLDGINDRRGVGGFVDEDVAKARESQWGFRVLIND